MKKSQVMSALAEMISGLSEIILCKGEQAYGIQTLRECRDDLQGVLDDLNTQGKTFNFKRVLLSVYHLIDCLHFWTRVG